MRDKSLAINISEDELLELKDQLECLKTEKVELEYNLAKALSTIDTFEQLGDLDALRNQNEKLCEEADRLRSLLDNEEDNYPVVILEEELERTKAKLNEANRKLAELQASPQKEFSTEEHRIVHDQEFQELERECNEAKLRVRVLEDTVTNLQAQLNDSASGNNSLSEKKEVHDPIPVEQSNLITSLEDQVAKLQFELARTMEALDESQNKCDIYISQLDSLSAGGHLASAEQLANSENDIQMLRQSNEYYSTQLKLRDDELASLRHQLNDLLSKNDPSLSEKLNSMKVTLQKKDEDILLLRDEISELKAYIEKSLLPSTQELEETLENRRALVQVLDNEIKDKKKDLKDLELQIEDVKVNQYTGPDNDSLKRIAELEDNLQLKELELQQLRDQAADDDVVPLLALEPSSSTAILPENGNLSEEEDQSLRKRIADLEHDIKLITEATVDRAEHEEEVALLEAEVKNLHAMSKVQAREIRALQRELGDLTCTNNDLRASISGVPSGDDARVHALEERLSALQKEVAFKDQEIAELQRTAGELGDSAFLLERTRDEAAAHEKEAAKLRDRLAARDQDVRDLEKECAEARARIRALEETPLVESQIQDLTAELEARTNEIDELRRLADDAINKKSDANIDKLLEDLACTTTERDNLQNEVSTLGKTINDLEQSLNATRAQMLESDANVSKLNDEISFLKDQLSTKCSELEEANSKIDSLKAEMEEKTVESASSNPDISSVPSLARSTSKSTQDLDELSIDELRELVDSERRRIKKLNNKITALMTEKNILNDQINAMKTSSARNLPPPAAPVVAETSSALVVSTDDVRIADLEQALKDANERADEKERELSDALQRIENLAMQVTSLETEISSLQDRLSSADEAVNKLRNESQQMNEQLTDDAQHKEIVASLTKELEDLKQKNSQLNAVKDDLKRQLEDKVKEIEHQQTEILNLSRVPDKVIDECSDHEIEEPRNVNRSDDIMARADRCVHFVAGMCVGASMMFGTQFLQNIVH